jgi:hypothetical protein
MKIGIPVYDGVGMLDIADALDMCSVCKGAIDRAARRHGAGAPGAAKHQYYPDPPVRSATQSTPQCLQA